jgi:F0F1-type ATP synthase assembly protein I
LDELHPQLLSGSSRGFVTRYRYEEYKITAVMVEPAGLTPITAWESFYVIVGSSAAALTGLQFVVIALIGESQTPSTMSEIRAFGTPTIVHFCAVLLISTIVSAPWSAYLSVALSLGTCGAIGVVYAAVIIRRARRQTGYKPVIEDWLWHCAFPFIAYSAVVLAAVLIRRYSMPSLFIVGGAVLLLLFIGIHNAWDTVTYIVVQRGGGKKD